MKLSALNNVLLAVLSFQVILCTRVDSNRLPDGRSSIIRPAGGDATTTLYLEATAPLNFPQGVLTSTVDTFINDGTTTEYMTQHIGTAINDVYAKIQTTSSREYYRIAPTASQNYNAPARPTGLIGSSTSLDIHGPVSTYYTIEEYRTYVDGHYAHLVSSITNVVTDTEQIKPTPAIGYDAYLNTDDQEAEQRIKDSVFSSYGIGGNNPSIAAVTKTIGHSFFHEDSKFEEEILNEIDDLPGTIKRPRQVDLDDLVAIESEANEIEIDPSKPVQALPTFTVDHNGQLNIPTPKIEVLNPITEKQKPARQHRFLPQDKPEKSTMASVTYIGFVDFTTTIDDTVVIFKPKNDYNTATKNIFPTRIEPTSSFTQSFTSSARPAIGQVKLPKAFDFNARPGLNIVDDDQDDKKESFEEEDEDEFRKHTSGINALKSLLSSSAALRSSVYNTVSRSRFNIAPSSSVPVFVSTTLSPSEELEQQSVGYEITESPLDLLPSIDPSADVELVFKTLYTTFTYFTTFYKESTTRVKSRLEIISNVNTLTNILKSTDLPAISISCELDSSCLFASDASGFVGRPNTRLFEQPRSQDGKPVSFNIIDDTIEGDRPRGSKIPNYFYTTYTYFKTITVDGTASVQTSTDIYSNTNTEAINIGVVTPVTEILPTSSAKITLITDASNSPSKSSISAFPVRRLEVSSIKDRQLQRELTTPETTDETTTNSLIDTRPTEESVFTIDAIEVSTVQTETTKNDGEDDTDSITTETPGLTEEVTEVSTTATTESSEQELDAESIIVAPRTVYTTYTYLTTLFKGSTTTVMSNLETVTNIVTDGIIQPTLIEESVTFYTTFTYWTTSVDGSETIITSSEETLTNILEGSAAYTSVIEAALPGLSGEEINATPPTNSFIEQTAFTFPTTSITEDLDGSEEISTVVPVLQSSEGEEDKSVFDTLATSSQFSLTSSQGFDDDDDFVLTTESNDEEDDSEENDDGNENRGRGTVRPSRVRNKLLFSRPGNSGNTFTPVIRPNLSNRQIPRLFKPSRARVSTTVATRTKNSVKPTLIATPASSAAVNSPLFDTSSRFLSSANFFSRGQSRFSSSQLRGSSIPISTSAFGAASDSINPSSVLQRGSKTFSSELVESTTSPTVFIRPIQRNKSNPFKARLKALQQNRLRQLQEANKINNDEEIDNDSDDNDRNSLSIPNFPSIPGGNAPIFVSSQRQTITRRPNTEANIDLPDEIKARRERARERIKSLFSNRRPFTNARQKRQVYGSDFGARTERRQSYIFRRSQSYPYTSSSQSSQSSSSYSQPQYFLNKDNPPFTAFRHSPAETSVNYDNDEIFNDNDDLYSSNLVPGSDVTKQQFRRQATDTRSRSRFRSRNPSTREETTSSPALTRTRTRFRDTRFRDRDTTTQPPTTTPSAVSRFSRFRPRTFSTDSRSINSFGSTRNQNLFNRDSTRSRFGTTDTSSTRNSLFSRPQVIDYSDYDYYDYADTDLQSSSEEVPDYITVTHQVPVATKIPVVEFGRTELRDILSTSPSLEVVAVTALKSTDINNSPVIYANAHTFTPQIGVQDILFDALRATETTRIEFTPTLIRGRRTQFSHIIPSTIYNVETVTTQIVEPVDQNQLLNSLLQHLLLGNSQSPIQSTPALPAINSAAPPLIVPSTPVTNFITHTSTYVTTITEEESTVLPITLRGKAITTTIIESSTKVVTATEYSTETQVHTPAVAPTIPSILAPILQTQAPVVPGLNQQLASLLPAILGSGGNPLLKQQQEQQALQQQQVLALQQQEALLAKKLQEQQQAQQIAREQEALNEQLLAKINLDDFTEEDLANLDIDAVLEAVSGQDLGVIFPKKNLFDNIQPTAVAAPAAGPSTSLLTIFKSGDRPGEFTSLVSTIVLDGRRIKRDAINPTTVQPIQKTELPIMNQIELFELGAARGPVDITLKNSFIIDTLPPNLVSSIDVPAHSTIHP